MALRYPSDWLIRAALAATAMVILAAIVWSAGRHGMIEHVHLRYTAHAFPAVLSHMFHGLPWDYTAYEGIADLLVRNGGTNAILEQATKVDGFNRELRFFPFDDKGYADLSLLGFTLFGVKLSSVFWAYVLLLGLSIVAFLVAMRRDTGGLVLLNVMLIGIYAALPAFPVSTELGSITNPRAMGVLSIIAMSHLLYLCLLQRRVTVFDALAALLQAALVTFVIFGRSPEIWQIGVVLVVSGMVFVISLRAKRFAAGAIISAASVIVCMLGLSAYQRATFHPSYFEKFGQTRLMWHNAGIGFALNPKLAAVYDLRVSDEAMFNLVAKRARAAGTYEDIFTDQDKLLLNPIRDFVRYEVIARDIVLEMIRKRPGQAAATFAFYKPYFMARTFLTAMGIEDGQRLDFEVAYLSPSQRSERHAFLSLLRLIPLTTLLICTFALWWVSSNEWPKIAGIIALIWAGGMIPAFASYPLYHVVGSTFVTTGALIYALMLGLMWIALRTLFNGGAASNRFASETRG